jgi:hypothetical protein
MTETDILKYQALLDAIFGAGAGTFKGRLGPSNHVLEALGSRENFARFGNNFEARLRRLQSAYAGTQSYPTLLAQARQVADPANWQGAFAELSAFDLFCSCQDFMTSPPQLNVSVAPNETLSSALGLAEANFDSRFEWFDVYTDVKVLKDNVREVLEGIYREIWPENRPMIGHEYSHIADCEPIRQSRSKIKERLVQQLPLRPMHVDCGDIVPTLRFRIQWSAGILTTESSYSPYRHAEELASLPLLHAKKFHRTRPFFLTFVSFPWFNQTISSFLDSNRVFYRALARRVFCGNMHNTAPFSTLMPRFQGTLAIKDVSNLLAGILFIEDTTILAEDPNAVNATGYFYSNPNSAEPIADSLIEDYVRSIVRGHFEDFRHDNY